MSLNPLRDALSQAGLAAARHDSPFAAESDAALATFRAVRTNLERQVRRGEVTPKAARQSAAEAAAKVRRDLLPRAEGFSPVPPVFLERLVKAADARKASRERGSLESLQRETNRLLRHALIESQLAGRTAEFEARAFVRSMTGGPASPTLDSLLRFSREAEDGGDEAAQEWGRRQLEAFRPRVPGTEDQARIDSACDRPERLNPRIVVRYVEASARPTPRPWKNS